MTPHAPSPAVSDDIAMLPELERYRQYLTVLARAQVLDRATRDRLDLSGVIQQTFLEAHAQLAQFRGSAPAAGSPELAAWLRSILSNNLADGMRGLGRAKRDATRERSLDREMEESSLRLGRLLAADQSSPSEHAQREERLVLLADAMGELPEAQREVVMLRHCQGWGLSRIADQVGRSPAAVAGLLQRGLRTLRQRLARGKRDGEL
jgi:RNA polymerase sigma-70 factor, ECF subfamily